MSGIVAGVILVSIFVVGPIAIATLGVVVLHMWRGPEPSKGYFQVMAALGVFLVGFGAGIAVGTDQVPWALLIEGPLFAFAGWYFLRSQDRSGQRT